MTEPTADAAVAALQSQHQALLLGLNHELRTPLTLIQTNLELLGRTGELSAEQRAFLERIAEGLLLLRRVVLLDLLLLAHIDALLDRREGVGRLAEEGRKCLPEAL